MKVFYEIKYLGIKVINNLRFPISSDIYFKEPMLFKFVIVLNQSR